ncbi:hypothetical protein YC2023_039623 [Brassica napus]
MNPKPPWQWRRLGMVYAINSWTWTIASSLFQRVGFHFHWIRGEKEKRVCEDMKWKKMESDDYQSQYEGCLRFWIEITTKHVISCSGSVWNRQRCNRWIVPPDLLSDKRRWITMDDSRTQDHIRPRTMIEQVSESVYPANELGSIFDQCIIDAFMPSTKSMLKMTHDEDRIAPPSSIQLEDETMLQAGSLMLTASGIYKPVLRSVMFSSYSIVLVSLCYSDESCAK